MQTKVLILAVLAAVATTKPTGVTMNSINSNLAARRVNVNAAASASASATPNTGSGSSGSGAAGAAGAAGADFGQCTPTMDFQLGRAGRKADEGTFLPTDPLVAEGQQDALNPNIITNRICDQLVNVCGANDAAVSACADAQTLVEGLGTKDASTADAFNAALGF